jgi:putative protease
VTGFASLQAGDLPVWQGWKVLPLAPVWVDGDRARADFLDWIGRQASGGPWLIGINNPAQLDWVRAARESGGGGPDVSPACSIAWFADYALYAANRQAQTLLAESLPGLLWAGPWIEQPGTAADPDFRPPLFISRACFRHQSLGQACPGGGPEACARRFDYRLEQGKQSFNVVVRDCLSYTFLAT